MKVLGYSAIADLFKYLPKSKANPQDVAVRQKLQVASWKSLWPIKMEKYVALGLSHTLGHKLGATYGIPHGITSVSPRTTCWNHWIIDSCVGPNPQCLTLSPVIALKAEIASDDDKDHLAAALFYLGIPSTGSVNEDVLKLSSEIDKYVPVLRAWILSSDLWIDSSPSSGWRPTWTLIMFQLLIYPI